MVAVDPVQLLTPGGYEAHGQVLVCVKQQGGNGRCISSARNLMLKQEVADGRQVFPDVFGHDV